jgi:hypothetical protein
MKRHLFEFWLDLVTDLCMVWFAVGILALIARRYL